MAAKEEAESTAVFPNSSSLLYFFSHTNFPSHLSASHLVQTTGLEPLVFALWLYPPSCTRSQAPSHHLFTCGLTSGPHLGKPGRCQC